MDLKKGFFFVTIIVFGVAIGMLVGNNIQDKLDEKASS